MNCQEFFLIFTQKKLNQSEYILKSLRGLLFKTSCILYRQKQRQKKIEYWRDLEMWVVRRSRSFEMALLDRLHTIYYSSSVVTMDISYTVFEIQRDMDFFFQHFNTILPSTVSEKKQTLLFSCVTLRNINRFV